MELGLEGTAVLVTGASGGIGAATARVLAGESARVGVHYHSNAAAAEALAAEVGGVALQADLRNEASADALVPAAVDALGRLDACVANAGTWDPEDVPVSRMSLDRWRATVDANLTATFLTLKSFLPGIIERGGGSIVTMASNAARFPTGAPAPYAAAKAGVIMLSRQVANEVGKHGVRVNCLAPHTVLTERVQRFMPEEQQRQMAAAMPLGRLGTPEDVALATLFLASDSSSWITGVTLDVAEGRTIV
jgi:3-oxoacyl-[acyl-carrier protein] reductase